MPAKRKRDSHRRLRNAKNAVRGAFNKPKAPYLESINRYGKAKLSPTDLIIGGVSQLGPEEAKSFSDWIKGFPSKVVSLFPTRPPKKPAQLALASIKIPMSLLTRLNWISILLEQSHDDLVIFVELANRYERSFLIGNFDEAQSLLDEISHRFGWSVWLIETQVALLQHSKGLDAQKDYARHLGNNARSRLAGVVAYWVSQRNEQNTTFARFCSRLEARIDRWEVAESTKDAYSIILGVSSFDRLSDSRASSALGALAGSSLIDAYVATMNAFQTMFTQRVTLLLSDRKLLIELSEKFQGEKPNCIPTLRIGPVASGSAVLANDEIINTIKEQHRKLLGVDMELYGMFSAVRDCNSPRPMTFGFKGVCDFADHLKNDKFQKYATYMSTEIMKAFAERCSSELLHI